MVLRIQIPFAIVSEFSIHAAKQNCEECSRVSYSLVDVYCQVRPSRSIVMAPGMLGGCSEVASPACLLAVLEVQESVLMWSWSALL